MTIHLAQAFPHPKTNPTTVAFHNIQVGNGVGLFFQQLLARTRMGLLSHPSRKEWNCSLCVLLAVQCPLQVSPITQPRVRHIITVPVPYSLVAKLLQCMIFS